jgi:hypothetical protein
LSRIVPPHNGHSFVSAMINDGHDS